uniref:Uncharacterized protein n=1 Tax=Ciona savignyi TaxID=51511 RepID=H2YYS1_CIOSA
MRFEVNSLRRRSTTPRAPQVAEDQLAAPEPPPLPPWGIPPKWYAPPQK